MSPRHGQKGNPAMREPTDDFTPIEHACCENAEILTLFADHYKAPIEDAAVIYEIELRLPVKAGKHKARTKAKLRLE
jgi:hypothetical protein